MNELASRHTPLQLCYFDLLDHDIRETPAHVYLFFFITYTPCLKHSMNLIKRA